MMKTKRVLFAVLGSAMVMAIVGCSGGGSGNGGTTATPSTTPSTPPTAVPAGQITESSSYAVSGNLAGGVKAPAGSAFRLASTITGNGTSITLADGQLVITGNVTTSSGTVPFYLTATTSSTGEVKSVSMTLGVGTTFTGSGTLSAGSGQIVLSLSNGTTITLTKQGVTKTGGSGATAKGYTFSLAQPRCDGSVPTLSGAMLVAFLPDDEVMLAMLAPGSLTVASGTRTATSMTLVSVNVANGNVGAGSATTSDAFDSLALRFQYCDTAGGCSCPPDRPLEATGTATAAVAGN